VGRGRDQSHVAARLVAIRARHRPIGANVRKLYEMNHCFGATSTLRAPSRSRSPRTPRRTPGRDSAARASEASMPGPERSGRRATPRKERCRPGREVWSAHDREAPAYRAARSSSTSAGGGVAGLAPAGYDLVRKTGLTREALYRALSPGGNPEFVTVTGSGRRRAAVRGARWRRGPHATSKLVRAGRPVRNPGSSPQTRRAAAR
jgi:hypothetical protein